MGKSKIKTLFLYDEPAGEMKHYSTTEKNFSYGGLFFVIIGTILIIAAGNVVLFSGQYTSTGLDPVMMYALLIIIGSIFVGVLIMLGVTRKTSKEFAIDLGWNEEGGVEVREWGKTELPGILRAKYSDDCPEFVDFFKNNRDYYYNELFQKFKKEKKEEEYLGRLCYEEEDDIIAEEDEDNNEEEAQTAFSRLTLNGRDLNQKNNSNSQTFWLDR